MADPQGRAGASLLNRSETRSAPIGSDGRLGYACPMRMWLVLLLALALGGCGVDPHLSRGCDYDEDCAPGERCLAGACVVEESPERDAGGPPSTDGGGQERTDAGMADAGRADAGGGDSGQPDDLCDVEEPPLCDQPPGDCFEPAGACDPADGACRYAPKPVDTPCNDGDLCGLEAYCDGSGTCVVLQGVTCDEPPGQCYAASGSCDAETGSCEYAPLPATSACSDGDGCTVDDRCDGNGGCAPGAFCPPPVNPCQESFCSGGSCSTRNKPDGVQCGAFPKDRCCGGTCVDISADAAHCGGCNQGCASGYACESVAVTSGCELSPANTTGRCGCVANSQCNGGVDQVCRTVTPYTQRCTPNGAGGCPGVFVDLNFCPNYCSY